MRQHKSRSIGAILLFLLLTLAESTIAQSDKTKNAECSEEILTITLQAPPVGMVNTRTIRFDQACRPIVGPVQTIALEMLSTVVVSSPVSTLQDESFDPIVSDEGDNTRLLRTLHAAQYVLDPINIILNDVHGQIRFTYNGTRVVSFWATGGTQSHHEPISCGLGWTARNLKNLVHSVGPNASFVTFKQQASFSYKGEFDCSGTLFDNKLKNFPKVLGTGSGSCTFDIKFLTGIESKLWHYRTTCYLLP